MPEENNPNSDSSPDMQRCRRLRFSLRSALVMLTFAAAASWAYWHGWPWYINRQAQLQFELNVKQEFAPGKTAYDARVFGGIEHTMVGYRDDSNGNPVAFACRVWPNKVYVIYGPHKKGSGAQQTWVEFEGVEVFRLNGLPAHYSPQTQRGRKTWQRHQTEHFGTKALNAYLSDFIEMVGGDRRDQLGFQFELIHQVPVGGR